MKALKIIGKILLALAALAAIEQVVLGYVGWTWIPIGKKAGKKQKKVACVGDSITYGAMITNWYKYNYPHQLQKLVGEKYCVHNYGMSARTGMDTGDHPYRKELRFKRSLAFKPDVVFLMFGTNDSKTMNWRGRDEFKRQYTELVKDYVNLPGNPKVFLLKPPAPHHMNGEEGDIYTFDIQRSKVLEAGEVIEEIAGELGLTAIDMYAFTKDHPEWFVKDGIHPNAEGATNFAEYLSRQL